MDCEQQPVEIEFLYLDLTSCGPRVASDASLHEAVALLQPVRAPARWRAGSGIGAAANTPMRQPG